jgi:hypothetical protein
MKNPFINAYKELAEFRSSRVFVCEDGCTENYKKEPVAIYHFFGGLFDLPHVIEILEYFKDSFTIVIVHRDYPKVELEQKYNCKFVNVKYAYAYYSKNLVHSNLYDQTDLKKKFLSLNNRAQWNRQALMQFLIKFNLLDDFYFSYWCADQTNVGIKNLYDKTNEVIGDTWFNQDLDLEKLYQMLPIKIPSDQFITGTARIGDWSAGKDFFYQTTFASFITETFIDENFNAYFSEKCMKAFAYGHPFLLSSSAGALDTLHNLGFQTFGDVFDESYDLIESPQLRFEQLLRETQRLCNLSLSELTKIKQHIWPSVVHNHDWFWNQMPKLYDDEMVSVKLHIQDILMRSTTEQSLCRMPATNMR